MLTDHKPTGALIPRYPAVGVSSGEKLVSGRIDGAAIPLMLENHNRLSAVDLAPFADLMTSGHRNANRPRPDCRPRLGLLPRGERRREPRYQRHAETA